MLCVIVCLVFISNAAGVSHQSRIVGGDPTTIQQYPYMANMLYYYGQWFEQACGGSLITTRTILSAAHCYHGYPTWWWMVRLGSSFASSGGKIHQIAQFKIHEEYNFPSRFNNDIAIVLLTTAATLSDSVQLTQISGPDSNLPAGTTVTAIGWGALSQGGIFSEQLRHVNINIINHTLCTERYAYLKSQPGNENLPQVTAGMLCSGILDVGGRDTCQGDSGGPLIFRDIVSGHVVVGITSWGYGCGHETYPGVSTRVSQYADWIVTHGAA